MDGFVHDPTVTLNLAYWVFPAFEYLGQHDDPMWNGIARTGWTLLDQAKFGAHKLPPDWLPGRQRPQGRGEDDALLWLRCDAHPALRAVVARCGGAPADGTLRHPHLLGVDVRRRPIPARVNLIDDTADSNPLPVGMQTIATWTIDGQPGPKADAADLDRMLYYDASLALLTEIAFAEAGR